MNLDKHQYPARRSLLKWGAALLSFALAAGAVSARCGDTIGSLPSAGGGDGSQNFFFSGPRELIGDAIVDAFGDGYVVVFQLPEQRIWIEFYGNVTLYLDERIMDDNPELLLGLTAGFNGGGMLVSAELDGEMTGRRWFVDMGFTLDTPYDGFLASVLGLDPVLHTLQVSSFRRGKLTYDSVGGVLIVEQELDPVR